MQYYSYGGKGAIPVYLWDDAQLKSVLDNATAASKKAGVSYPKAGSAKSRDAARAIVVFAENECVDHIVVGTGGKGGYIPANVEFCFERCGLPDALSRDGRKVA